jgi:uroporphyrinogen-III synthase
LKLKRILITSLSQLNPEPFRIIGYDPIRASTIRIEPDNAVIDGLRRSILEGRFDSAAFMSPRSMGLISPDDRLVASLSSMKVYAVGPSTKRSLEMLGIPVTGTPDEYTGRALAELIANAHSKSPFKRLALIRSSLADDSLADWLRSKHMPVDEFRVYRTVADQEGILAFMAALGRGVDIAVFTSRSSSSLMLEYLRSQGMDSLLISALRKSRVIAFGPEAAAGLRSAGIEPEILSVHSLDGLISHLKVIGYE